LSETNATFNDINLLAQPKKSGRGMELIYNCMKEAGYRILTVQENY